MDTLYYLLSELHTMDTLYGVNKLVKIDRGHLVTYTPN